MDNNAVTFFTGFTLSIGFVVVLIELVVMCFIELFSRKEKEMFKDQIEAGAKLLDEKLPGWVEKQNLEELDLSNPYNCVVGQACPDQGYTSTICELLLPDEKLDTFDQTVNHGFATSHPETYPQLTKEWKAYITDRRSHVSN